jgi:hypothetical protein
MDKYAKWFWIIMTIIFIGAMEDIFLGDTIIW